ncbi:MAG: hypothetical protein QOK04_554 [Solirubrobacteraceae bacterium]|nr:hypothetical protein [Solirubrobacteraceae bacterium]
MPAVNRSVRRRWRGWLDQTETGRGGDALAAGIVVVLTTGFAALALRLWHADLSVPFGYSMRTDSKFYLMLVKDILDHGWYLHNSSLGAPFGQALYDFPQGGDNANFLLIKFLGLFSHDPAVVTNVFFTLTFPLAGLSSFLVFRRLRGATGPAVVCAVLFALLPYHFFRGESHLLLSTYYVVPIGAYLVLAIIADRPLFARRPGSGRWRWASRTTLATVALCVLIGSGGLYYATFTGVLALGATLIAAVAWRRRATALTGLAVTALIACTLTVNVAPSLVHWAKHGRNAQVAQRTPADSETFGLKLTQLVLPAPHHRIPLLARVNRHYSRDVEDARGYSDGAYATLGLVGTIGLAVLCFVAAEACVVMRQSVGGPLHRYAAVATGMTFVIGATGGVSALIAYFVTTEIRAWNRLSLFIAFWSLLGSVLLLQSVAAKLRATPRQLALGAGLLVATLAVGLFDQTSDSLIPKYAPDARQYHSDARFVRAIERRLPGDAAVFQLPYVPFPEAITRVNHSAVRYYEPTRGYLHSDRLRWSFGAMRGTSADWQSALTNVPIARLVPGVAAAGFQGVWIDRSGYLDHGRRIERDLTSILREPPLASSGRDLSFFDLRPYRTRLLAGSAARAAALRTATLRPLRVGGSSRPRRLYLLNPSRYPRAGVLTATIRAPARRPTAVVVTFPDGSSQRLEVTAAGTVLRHALRLAPGRSVLRLAVQGGRAAVPRSGRSLLDAALA